MTTYATFQFIMTQYALYLHGSAPEARLRSRNHWLWKIAVVRGFLGCRDFTFEDHIMVGTDDRRRKETVRPTRTRSNREIR
jgi:hypothetical protein